MQSIFGLNGERAQALITRLANLSAEEMNIIADAWKQGSTLDRARAWAHLSRVSTEQERSQILAAASLARREALTAAHRLRSADWTIWAAASDAAAALVAGIRLGRHYTTLTAPLAAVMPSLLVYNPRPPLDLLPELMELIPRLGWPS